MASIQSGHRYIIRNKKSNNSVLDLDNGTKRKVQCWTHHGSPNQQVESDSISLFHLTEKKTLLLLKWDFVQQSDNTWHIKNVAFGKYLAFDGNAQDAQPIIGRDQPYGWHIWESKNDKTAYKYVESFSQCKSRKLTNIVCSRICVPGTSQNLDLTDHGNPANGTLVQLWTQWDGENQFWRVDSGKFFLLDNFLGSDQTYTLTVQV